MTGGFTVGTINIGYAEATMQNVQTSEKEFILYFFLLNAFFEMNGYFYEMAITEIGILQYFYTTFQLQRQSFVRGYLFVDYVAWDVFIKFQLKIG